MAAFDPERTWSWLRNRPLYLLHPPGFGSHPGAKRSTLVIRLICLNDKIDVCMPTNNGASLSVKYKCHE